MCFTILFGPEEQWEPRMIRNRFLKRQNKIGTQNRCLGDNYGKNYESQMVKIYFELILVEVLLVVVVMVV